MAWARGKSNVHLYLSHSKVCRYAALQPQTFKYDELSEL